MNAQGTGTGIGPANDGAGVLGIQELSRQLGITARALRFYEDKGLIAPRRAGTTRVYTRREVGRVRLIMRGKQLGFSIREIKEFLDLYDADPEHVGQVRRLLDQVGTRLAELERQRHALEQTISELSAIRVEAEGWLAGHGSGG